MKPGSATKSTDSAEAITRASKSNLALTFVSLSGPQRRDITVFYAFCRLIDDIADASDLAPEEKATQLQRWREALYQPVTNESAIAPEMRRLIQTYPITPVMVEEVIEGVEMDLSISRYPTFAALRDYCYHVASAVGLVSIEIFGYKNNACREYAVELGLALQVTNILRDVGKDLERDRVYLPQEDRARFGYTDKELLARTYNEKFVQLMRFEARRAHGFFDRAAALLPAEDRRSMVSAEIMGAIYRALLRRMERDSFHVFQCDYGLSKAAKSWHVLRQLLRRP